MHVLYLYVYTFACCMYISYLQWLHGMSTCVCIFCAYVVGVVLVFFLHVDVYSCFVHCLLSLSLLHVSCDGASTCSLDPLACARGAVNVVHGLIVWVVDFNVYMYSACFACKHWGRVIVWPICFACTRVAFEQVSVFGVCVLRLCLWCSCDVSSLFICALLRQVGLPYALVVASALFISRVRVCHYCLHFTVWHASRLPICFGYTCLCVLHVFCTCLSGRHLFAVCVCKLRACVWCICVLHSPFVYRMVRCVRWRPFAFCTLCWFH